jgi:putative DNA primase/helicase
VAHDITSSADIGGPPERPSLLQQPPGDTGNAQRFLAWHRADVRYCHAFKCWFVWDGRRWSRDDQGRVISLTKKVMLEFLAQAINANDREAEKLAKSSLDVARIKGLLTLAQDEVPIRPAELDRHPDLLVFQNGVLDLRTGVLRAAERQHYITKLVAFDYRPEAACPLFLQVLAKLMGSEADPDRAQRLVDALQVYLGYSLTGHTSAKAVFMFVGPKDTGKTTILELFCKLLAEHSTLIRIETLMQGPAQRTLGLRADLADLHGTRFARTSETEEGKRLNESQLKYITQGAGSIRAERKFENPFDFEETHKLWIDANHKPVIRGTDSAIWDRLITIPCEVVVSDEDKDPELIGKLLLEAEGTLAWAVAGAQRWFASTKRLPRPAEVRLAGEAYRAEMDTVGRFLDECCEFGGSFSVRSSEIYAAYRHWAERSGEHPMAQVSFSQRLKNRSGVSGEHKEWGTLFTGVRLRPEEGPPDADDE